LVGPDHQLVPAGEVGELIVRGPNGMRGYYRAPEETAAATDAEGWFNNGVLQCYQYGATRKSWKHGVFQGGE